MTIASNCSFRFIFIIATSVLAGHAVAGDFSPWYIGGNVGQSTNSTDDDRITTGIYNGGITTGGKLIVTGILNNDSSTGYKLFGGYQINSHFAIEAGYVNLGKLGFTAYTNPTGSLTGVLKPESVVVDGLASWAVDEKTALYARAGIAANHVEANFSNAGAVQILRPSYSDDSAGYTFGIGASRSLGEAVELRLEGESYHLNDSVNHHENITLISLGMIYRF